MSSEHIESFRPTSGGAAGLVFPPADDDATAERIGWRKWYVLGILTFLSIFAYMDRYAPAMLLQMIKTDLKVSDRQLGLISGVAFAIFYSIFGIPLARLADRTSRVRLLAICTAFWCIMTTLSGMALNFGQLFLARIGVGFGEGACIPAAHSMIGDLFPRNRRSLAICIFQAGGSIGASGGLFFVGLLTQHFDWRGSLQIVGFAGVPLSLLLLLTVREPKRSVRAEKGAAQSAPVRTESTRQAVKALLSRRAYVHLLIAYGLGATCTLGFGQWIPAFLIRSFSMNVVQVGAWSGLATIVGGVIGIVSGGVTMTWLASRDPRWELWLPAISYVFCTLLYALMFLSPTPLLSLLAKTIATLFTSFGGGIAIAAVQSFAEPNRRGTAIAVFMFFSSLLGTGGGPYLIGWLSDLLAPRLGRESLRYAMLAMCTLMLLSVVHFMLAARSAPRDRVD